MVLERAIVRPLLFVWRIAVTGACMYVWRKWGGRYVSWIGLGLYEQWGLGWRVIVMSMSLSHPWGKVKKWIQINGLFVSYLRLAVEGKDKVHACLLFRWPFIVLEGHQHSSICFVCSKKRVCLTVKEMRVRQRLLLPGQALNYSVR